MKKKLIGSLVLGTILCFSLVGTSVASGLNATFTDIKLFLNGNRIEKPILVNDGTSYLPIRALSETLGLKVDWNGEKREINLTGNTAATTPADLMTSKDLVGEWAGSYTANQGLTKLNITITDEGNALSARFDFGPTVNNPTVPEGAGTMKVTFDETTKAIKFVGDQWINRPSVGNWVFVDLIGSVSGDYINGAVIGQDDDTLVGTFSVQKIK